MPEDRRIRYQQGDHFCALYRTPEEQLTIAADYIRAGLERGERCFYICGEHSVGEFREGLQRSGIAVEFEEARGALLLSSKDETYLEAGKFDPERMLLLLTRAVQDALDAGFTGLCSGGDMTWILDDVPGSYRLPEYEARLNEFSRSQKAIILCLYNRISLPIDVVDHSIATHCRIHLEGPILLENPFLEPDHHAMFRRAHRAEIVSEKIEILEATGAALFANSTLSL